ncbi:hypothetical protein VPH35_134112 [Triticum aestivum]
MRGSGLVSSLTVILLLIGYLAVIAHGPHASNYLSHKKSWNFLNFSSICFEFFSDREQMSLGTDLDFRPRPCYCCELLPPDQPCFGSKEECWQKCPACDPKCPGPPATELHP